MEFIHFWQNYAQNVKPYSPNMALLSSELKMHFKCIKKPPEPVSLQFTNRPLLMYSKL